jgi:7-carboxy-7-deazaguanine synthase
MKVKEIFYTLQGEGLNSGRPAVFCRFTGCNLWTGYEKDREKAVCKFCDTDFVGGESYTEEKLIEAIISHWPNPKELDDCANGVIHKQKPLVVFTGGEPGLQITESLISTLRKHNFNVAIETNGTVELPKGTYWITVSPKYGSEIKQTKGNELKLVWPQPFDLGQLLELDFDHYWLQPMDGHPGALEKTIDAVMNNPAWKLSLQTHKIMGVR